MLNWQYIAFGFLFFLASCYFADIVCNEELVQKEGLYSEVKFFKTFAIEIPVLIYFLGFLFSAISLFFINSQFDFIVYSIIQLISVAFSVFSINNHLSKKTTLFLNAEMNVIIFIIILI